MYRSLSFPILFQKHYYNPSSYSTTTTATTVVRSVMLCKATRFNSSKGSKDSSSSSSDRSSNVHPLSKEGFNKVADQYDKGRPSYPTIATDLLKNLKFSNDTTHSQQQQPLLMDIGAGSGKFTSVLTQYFPKCRLYAVEPAPNFVQILQQKFKSNPNITIVKDEVAYMLDNPIFQKQQQSFDAIFAAQCFHWFATRNSLRVFHQLLKDNGYLFLIWNRQIFDNEFLKELKTQILNPYDNEEGAKQMKFSYLEKSILELFSENNSLFTPVKNFTIFRRSMSQRGKIDFIYDRVLSKSTFAVRTPQEREQVKEKIKSLVIKHYGSIDINLELPYDTYVLITQKITSKSSKL